MNEDANLLHEQDCHANVNFSRKSKFLINFADLKINNFINKLNYESRLKITTGNSMILMKPRFILKIEYFLINYFFLFNRHFLAITAKLN